MLVNLFVLFLAIIVLFVAACLVAAAPGLKCEKCGSRKTYHTTEEKRDTYRPGITHVSRIRNCISCKHEQTLSSEEVPTSDLDGHFRPSGY